MSDDLTAVTDLIQSCLPVDHEDGTTLVEVVPSKDGNPPLRIYGDPRRVAGYIAARLHSAGMLAEAAADA